MFDDEYVDDEFIQDSKPASNNTSLDYDDDNPKSNKKRSPPPK